MAKIENIRKKREKLNITRLDQEITIKDKIPAMTKEERKELKNKMKEKWESIVS